MLGPKTLLKHAKGKKLDFVARSILLLEGLILNFNLGAKFSASDGFLKSSIRTITEMKENVSIRDCLGFAKDR